MEFLIVTQDTPAANHDVIALSRQCKEAEIVSPYLHGPFCEEPAQNRLAGEQGRRPMGCAGRFVDRSLNNPGTVSAKPLSHFVKGDFDNHKKVLG